MNTEVVGVVTEHRRIGLLEFNLLLPKYAEGLDSKGDNLWYKPVISYEVAGKVYEYCPRAAYRGHKELDVGEKVTVYYDTDNPSKCKLRHKFGWECK